MVKNELLKVCRYYKGEDTTPDNYFAMLEKLWVEAKLKEDDFNLSSWSSSLVNHGLLDWANKEYPDIPTTLIGAILERFMHHITYQDETTATEFKQYFKKYLSGEV